MWQQAGEPQTGVYSGWVNVGAPDPGFKDAPAVTSFRSNRLDIVVCGRDDGLWYKVYDGNNGGWTGWERPEGTITSGPAITSNPNPIRLDFFARASDGELEHWSPSDTGVGWENLGNQFVGQPAAASWGPGRLDVFVVNLSGELWWWWSES
jgi:hypothetical protein